MTWKRADSGTLNVRCVGLATCVGLLALSLGVCPPAIGSTDSPTAVVQQTTDAVVAILADKSLTADQKRHQVEAIVYARFDFTTLAKLVLARNWKQLTPEQQTQFVAEFKRHLSMTYGKNVETYNNERAVVTGDRAEARDDWTVKTKIVRPSASDILVDYRLRKAEDGSWQVIDVIIEGVSLVANFRSQFQDIITKDGAAKLIEMLREKNEKGESFKS